MPFRSPVFTSATQTLAWPRFIEVLIGIIAGGIPELTFFLWWSFQADSSASMNDIIFIMTAIEALLVGGVAGLICRACWSRPGPATLYRVFNTLVWACAGSFAGYFVPGFVIGAHATALQLLVPFCQGVTMLLAMVYARCGGLAGDYMIPHLPNKRI
jgi:hypothetical protein